jgi:PilZ domain
MGKSRGMGGVKLPDIMTSDDARSAHCAERRSHKRAPVLRPVRYFSVAFGETCSHILDLGEGGAYIESPVVPVGSEIDVEFPLVSGHTVRATAVVRYTVLGAGMGVEFVRISAEDRAQIASLVESFRVPVTTRADW